MELMEEVSIISKGKIILSTTLLFIGLTAFSQSKPTKNTTRPEIIYKQSHSSNDGKFQFICRRNKAQNGYVHFK